MKSILSRYKRKSTGFIILNVGAYLLAIIAIIFDLKFNLNSETLANFVSIMYPSVISVAGFLITVYILFLELYKDRYPLENMQKKQFPNTKYYTYAVIYNIVIGAVVLCIETGFASFILFCITSLITIISIFLTISKSNKSLMLTFYMENFCKEITDGFDANEEKLSSEIVQNIKNILDECVIKEEYHTVGMIVEKTGEIFRGFLKNSITIASSDENSDQALEMFDKIVNLNIFELELCKNIKSSELIKKTIRQQYKNLCFCVKNHQMEWYKKYFEKYLKFLYISQNEDLMDVVKLSYSSIPLVIQCLFKCGYGEYVEDTLKKIDEANNTSVRINKKGNARVYIQFLGCVANYAIEEKNEELIDSLIQKTGQYCYTLIEHSESFANIVEYYKWIFTMILNYSTDKAIAWYENMVGIFSCNYVNTPILIECNMYCLTGLIEKEKEEKRNQEKLINYHIDLLYQISKAKEKYIGYLIFPDFDAMICEKEGNVEEIQKVAGYIKRILNQCIIGDNIPLFYEMLNRFNALLTNTKPHHKFVQEGLLSIYFWLINRTHQLVNKQFLEITFFNLNAVIETLDSKKSISESLGTYIIDNLHASCKGNLVKNGDSSIEIVEMLSAFLLKETPYYFVVTKPSLKKLLYKTLFNIGTDCIENGFEEGARSVSNELGWLIIKSIKQGDDALTTYLIERVSEFYSIAITMEISHKTRMFMLTLFPTVGAFCCKEAGYSKYCKLLIKAIEHEPYKNVETAVRLRTSENDMWNDLYEGETDILTRKFMEKYRKAAGANDTASEAGRVFLLT